MRKLLSANFSRLWKDKIFWMCMGGILIYSIIYMLNGCRQGTVDLSEYNYSIDKYYFHFAISIGGFCALFSSLFFGTEYSDGTMRNKIIIGHTRTSIYIANYITTFTATLLMTLVWLIGALIAIPVLGFFEMGILNLIVCLLIIVMFVSALCAIFTFVCTQSSSKAITVVISLLLFLGLLIFASIIYNSLNQEEMLSGIYMTANGMETGEPTPNPNYISGVKRNIYEFIVDVLPTGQGLKMAFLQVSNPIRMIVSSIIITIITTLSGILIFKRKNLR